MHSLVDSCRCLDWGSSPQPWCIRTTLWPTELSRQGKSNFFFKKTHPWLPVVQLRTAEPRLWNLQFSRKEHCLQVKKMSRQDSLCPTGLLWPLLRDSHRKKISDVWGITLTTDPALRLAFFHRAHSLLHPNSLLNPSFQPEWAPGWMTTPHTHTSCKGVKRGQSPMTVLVSNSPSRLSRVPCQHLQTPPDIGLHGRIKNNCSLKKWESPGLLPLIPLPLLMEISAALRVQSSLTFLFGVISWSLFSPLRRQNFFFLTPELNFLFSSKELERVYWTTQYSHRFPSILLIALWNRYCCFERFSALPKAAGIISPGALDWTSAWLQICARLTTSNAGGFRGRISKPCLSLFLGSPDNRSRKHTLQRKREKKIYWLLEQWL